MQGLEEALEEYPDMDYDTEREVNGIPATFSKELFEQMKESMKDEREQLTYIKKKAKEGIGYCSDLINLVKQDKVQSRSIDSKVEKIKAINKALQEMSIYCLLDELVVANMKAKFIKVFTTQEDEKDNLLNVYDSSRSYYEGLLEAAKFAEPVLERTVQELDRKE